MRPPARLQFWGRFGLFCCPDNLSGQPGHRVRTTCPPCPDNLSAPLPVSPQLVQLVQLVQ